MIYSREEEGSRLFFCALLKMMCMKFHRHPVGGSVVVASSEHTDHLITLQAACHKYRGSAFTSRGRTSGGGMRLGRRSSGRCDGTKILERCLTARGGVFMWRYVSCERKDEMLEFLSASRRRRREDRRRQRGDRPLRSAR